MPYWVPESAQAVRVHAKDEGSLGHPVCCIARTASPTITSGTGIRNLPRRRRNSLAERESRRQSPGSAENILRSAFEQRLRREDRRRKPATRKRDHQILPFDLNRELDWRSLGRLPLTAIPPDVRRSISHLPNQNNSPRCRCCACRVCGMSKRSCRGGCSVAAEIRRAFPWIALKYWRRRLVRERRHAHSALIFASPMMRP
jgi:hypothetical protein